ncbi:MAG: hypothetical protein QM756_36315 [Polyangiaceae bacterium]
MRVARRRVRQRRIATIASTATFLVIGIVGSIVMFELFPEQQPMRSKLVPVFGLAFVSAVFVSKRLNPVE